ncbi:uncharacterized protein JCM15063_003170 [Sporobolomyces koalae]|uniref:uncharacterized protein n=1 Tax=Sporobolomyces koalae TaxID=500713 RepID=UPI003174807D
MGLILKDLPAYTGPYSVSTHNVELAYAGSSNFSSARLRSTHEPALVLDTVLFTLFYPTSTRETPRKQDRMPWFDRPLSLTARGYARFLGKPTWLVRSILWIAGRNLYLPGSVDAPLLDDSRHPVVIFSHGLSGNRTTYSQYCGELASRGHVVVALEHRDGSGPISVVHLDDSGHQQRIVDYIKEQDIYYEHEKDQIPFLAFRAQQLEMRQKEISIVLDTLKQIDLGHGAEIDRKNRRRNPASAVHLAEWRHKLDLEDRLVCAGHSFGGATTIQALRSNRRFGFKKGIALDPWADPIPPAADSSVSEPVSSAASTLVGSEEKLETKPSATPALGSDESPPTIPVPLLVINSEAFTLWKPHFYLVRNVAKSVENTARSWFFTILGSVHLSFSDIPLVLPSFATPKQATTPASTSFGLIVETSIEYLKDEYDDGQYLSREVKQGDEEYVNRRRGEGEKGPLQNDDEQGYVRLHYKQ